MDKSPQLQPSDPVTHGALGSTRPVGAEGSFQRTCSCARCCFVQRRAFLTSTQQGVRDWSPDDARMPGHSTQ